MKTSIVITKPASVYHSGDSVTGFVCLTATPSDTVRKVSLDFCGTATSAARGDVPFIEHVTLISEEEVLYAGVDVLKPRDHQWPFNFTIPEFCEQHESQNLKRGKESFFNASSRQSLPPSFENAAHSRPIVAEVNRIGSEKATVAYCFKASFFENNESNSKSVTTTIPLNIQPRQTSGHPTWDITTHVCRFKIPLQDKRRPSLTNIFTSRRGHNQENATEILLRARIATTLVAGKPIPIFLLLEHDIAEETSAPRSTFSIRSITVTLVAETSVRGHCSLWLEKANSEAESTWETTKKIGSKLTYSVAIQNGGILDIRSLLPDLIVPDSETPSFATFNIVHIHSLRLKVELMYHNRSFIARFDVKRVIILPTTNSISEPQLEPPTTQSTPIASATYPLRRAIDEELEPTDPPTKDEPPSFETAVSATTSTTLSQPTTRSSEDPPPFEAVPTAAVERRGSTLHPRLSMDEPPAFDSAIGEEELPSYAREETY